MRFILLAALAVAPSGITAAQISFTGTYYQDFDSLGTAVEATLPNGWRAEARGFSGGPGSYSEAGTTTDLRGGNRFGIDSPGGIVNFGAGPAESASERAVGFSLVPGEVESVVLYAWFRNDTGAPLVPFEFWYGNADEAYRGGDGDVYATADVFYSRNGISWIEAPGGTLYRSTNRDGYDDAPGGLKGRSYSPLPTGTPISPGGDLYFAFVYGRSSESTSIPPVLAFDEFVIASPPDAASAVWPSRGERLFGEVPVGTTSAPLPIDANVAGVSPEPADRPTPVLSGPHASDFEITPSEGGGYDLTFTPGGTGEREGTLTFVTPDTTSRPVALRGVGLGATTTAGAPDAASISLRAWPNPVSGLTHLSAHVSVPGPARLTVHDARGREIAVVFDGSFRSGSHSSTFDVSGLAPGLYVARLVTPQESTTIRLTVSR